MAFLRSGFIRELSANSPELHSALVEYSSRSASDPTRKINKIIDKITKRSWCGQLKLKSLESRIKVLNQAIKDRDETIDRARNDRIVPIDEYGVQKVTPGRLSKSNNMANGRHWCVNALVAVEVALLKGNLKKDYSTEQISQELTKYNMEVSHWFGRKSLKLHDDGMTRIRDLLEGSLTLKTRS
ncbi:MAG TPA: hypothetical protein VJK48_00625 [Chlamydiales bacterium]|nr:MAG: hypothetical protein A3F67_08550 [Verrucomicrobia bacterium RIFCSPHIGHO2_12_FULL_41_10]HLB52198.1 hypothetical protein [Chlamydiales bacterium]